MNFKEKLKLVVAVSLAGAGSAFAATVFEVPAGNNSFYSTSLEYGDQVALSGLSPGWTLESITIPYYSNYASTGALTVKLYANDGFGGSPGTVLYSSAPLDILDDGATISIPFANTIDNIAPSGFTYTVSFAGFGGNNSAGLIVPNLTPSVGTSFNDYWENTTGTGWQLRTMANGDLANFQVSITAVPEPSVIALAGLGLAGLLGLAARRSRKS
mgnify:CR=1 FL=1